MRHFDTDELAARWEMSSRTLERWRLEGKGPDYLKLGGAVRYPEDSVIAFEKQHLRTSTSDHCRQSRLDQSAPTAAQGGAS